MAYPFGLPICSPSRFQRCEQLYTSYKLLPKNVSDACCRSPEDFVAALRSGYFEGDAALKPPPAGLDDKWQRFVDLFYWDLAK